MAARILRHRKYPNGAFTLLVTVDDTARLPNGQPDPECLRRFRWGPPPDGVTEADWIAMQLRETRLLVAQELVPQGAGTMLPSEGETL